MMRAVAVRAVIVAVAVASPWAEPPAVAQSGWLPTSWFAPGADDPQAMYPLAENDGPWLVLATTFRGERAREEARQLVQELRAGHKLQAYTHEKAFDFTGEQRGAGFKPDGTPKRMRYLNEGQVIEVAVLVGDFASFEDPRGQKTLQKIKTLRPKTLGGSAKSRLVSDFLKENQAHVQGGEAAAKPPMHAALMIPNPLLPADYFSRQQVDDFVMEMNADVTNSLLDCPARYTVRVATFTGAGTFNTGAAATADEVGGFVDVARFVDALKGKGWRDPQVKRLQQENGLVEAADKAHRLTEALRRNGWQAWEFHDRDESIVCVGGIDQLAVPGPDGRPVPHPELQRIVAGLGPDQGALARGEILPRSFDGIMLDVQPKPVDVPRTPTRRR